MLAVPYVSFVLTSLFLKWNFTYGVRVHMAAFFIWGALAGVLFGLKRARLAAPVLVTLLALQLAPAFWLNPRSLFPGRGVHLSESEQLLLANPNFRAPAVRLSIAKAMEEARSAKPEVVGLRGEPEWFEYVVMRSLSGGNPLHPRFVSPNVGNSLGQEYLPPDLIVAGEATSSLVDSQTGWLYQAVRQPGRLTVLFPAARTEDPGRLR